MRILVVGATGDVGGAVADALSVRHEVLRASRKAADPALRVDIAEPDAIRALFRHTGRLGAVICCAGEARPGALTALTDEDFAQSLKSKLMGQVNLVRFGLEQVADDGVFVLTAGIFGTRPTPRVPAMAMVNGALESFARAASKDLPRGIRLHTVSSPFLQETATRMGMKGAISAADNAQVYVRLVEGAETAPVVYP
jgi:NAD(P)-dependent dehydrogenase (short-subunit alcohol dehydrogenase family)